ncbi:hypothetical protein H6G88_08900 [Bifidobacterium ruminantium]|uniref:hypothetical protein n=1 Tax=Bifidobacterium ruminantium TaxID=78346 RepID=UPI00195B23E1|nr:hypothetical protein [Bifidobacterium ruminantium]MBM6747396.1 hypothetical protein [Bifidobacterium ruminantium]
MQQNIIWTNDTDQIDAIIDDWKREAAKLAPHMARNPKETMADTTYGVDTILEKAWEHVVGEYELPTPQRLVEAIETIDPLDDTHVRIMADDLNTEYRADEQDNLQHLKLAHPVIILGKAGLWNDSRAIASVVEFDNIGDIISDSPWTGMEFETWKIDGHDDLRYIGVHHDGVNTCTFRELKTDGRGEKPIEENDLRALLRASRPLGPRVRDVYGMPAPAKKHGNR